MYLLILVFFGRKLVAFSWTYSLLLPLLLQPSSSEEKEGHLGRLAALVVCVPGLVPLVVPERRLHLLHSAVRLPVRQGEVHQVGHVSGPLPLPEHLHPAASKGDHSADLFLCVWDGLKKKTSSQSGLGPRWTCVSALRWSASRWCSPCCWNLWLWRRVKR